MFPLDSFRLARTLAATAGVLACSSVDLAATGVPFAAAAVLAVLAGLLGYGARYEARNVRRYKRSMRDANRPHDPWKPIVPVRGAAMQAFADRENAVYALEAGRLTPTPALTLVDLKDEAAS